VVVWSQDGVVFMATRLRAGRYGVRIPSASYAMGNGDLSRG